MDLVLWFFLLITSYSSCLSTVIVTPDTDETNINDFSELMTASSIGLPLKEFSYDHKWNICVGIIGSLYIRRYGWVYVKKPDVYGRFSTQCPDCITDHYSQNDINECFVVQEHQINFHSHYYSVSSFGCLAEDSTTPDYPYREIFVSYANVQDTFFISLRENQNIGNERTMLHYIGIAEMSPNLVRNSVEQGAEIFFRNDMEKAFNTKLILNRMSPSRRYRLCKIALSAMEGSIKPEMVESWSVVENAMVNLPSGSLTVDAVLQCLVYPKSKFNRYIALSKINRSAVYLLRQMNNPPHSAKVKFELTQDYITDIPTLSEGYILDLEL